MFTLKFAIYRIFYIILVSYCHAINSFPEVDIHHISISNSKVIFEKLLTLQQS